MLHHGVQTQFLLANYYLSPANLTASELGASQLQVYGIIGGWGKD